MIFPLNTSITYSTPSSLYRFATGGVNYNIVNATLTMFQSSTSLDRFRNANVFIGFVTYRAPKSCRIQNIQFKIMKRGYEKMVGYTQINAEINSYALTSVALN
jgi:hypothetical protein